MNEEEEIEEEIFEKQLQETLAAVKNLLICLNVETSETYKKFKERKQSENNTG